MKVFIKWICIIITVLIFLYAFSSSYYSQNIDHLDYVIALGIDAVPNSDILSVSFEFANLGSFSENSSSTKTEPIINTILAPSIPNAISIMNAYLGKQLNLSHCKVITFSKDYASKGLLNDVSYLTHNVQIRPTTNVVISDSKAVEYLRNSTSSLEQVLTKYYSIFPTSSEYTGYTSNVPLGLFYETLLNPNIGSVAILGNQVNSSNINKASQDTKNNSSPDSNNENSQLEQEQNTKSSQNNNNINKNFQSDFIKNYSNYQAFDPKTVIIEGDHGTENIGLTVFKDDKYIGDLSTVETLCHSLLKNDVSSFLITIDSPFDKSKKLDIYAESLSEAIVNVELYEDHPKINIKMNLSGDVLNILNINDLNYNEALNIVNTEFKKYLVQQFNNYLYKTSKEFNSDINNFHKLVKKQFLTIDDLNNYNWSEKYEKAEFEIEFNDNILSNILIKQ